MKNIIRKWLGVAHLEQVVLHQANAAEENLQAQRLQVYEMFHALPFIGGAMVLTAADAVKLTMPEGVPPNGLPALLVGVIAAARQGNSYLQVEGDLSEAVANALTKRGFRLETQEGTAGKSTFILWT